MGFRVISLDALDVSNRNATVLATGKRVKSVLASLGIDDNSKQVARAMLAAKSTGMTIRPRIFPACIFWISSCRLSLMVASM